MAVDWVSLGFALLVSSGGVAGYLSAGSVPSLAAGLLFGLLAAVGAYMTSRDPRNIWLSLGTCGTLAVVMGLRFLSSGKFMPAGFMTVVSCLMLLKVISGSMKRPRHI